MKSRLVLLAVAIACGGRAIAADEELQEVIVTAEHREASLQKTQISMTALTGADITSAGISNAADLGQYVPNVTVAKFDGSSLGYGLNIRGVGQNETIVTFDPAAGMYIDDVLIPKSPGALIDVLDMERIEVLRGPQGTLYGRNTIAGAINYITQKPTDKLEGYVRATLGNYGERDYKGMLNLPLLAADSPAGALDLRISAASIKRDGLIENLLPGAPTSQFENKNRNVEQAHVQWRPMDALTVRYSYDRSRIDESPQPQFYTTFNPASPLGQLVAPYAVTQDERPTTVMADSPERAQLKAEGHALDITYDISNSMTFRSITGYRANWSGGVNEDSVPFQLINTVTDQTEDSFTQEFRLGGKTLGDRLNYSSGAFYMDEHGSILNELILLNNPSTTTASFENRNWAIYGQGTYALAERWTLTAGARYTHENREMSKAESTQPSVVYPEAKRSFNDVSPMASVGYSWNDDVNTYFKVSKGYQSGGFNVRDTTVANFLRGFDAEKLVAYELGTKATSSEKRFRANTALWFSDYSNKRVNNFDPSTLSNVIRNAGAVQIYGAELELLGKLTEHWQVGADYGYTKGKYVKYDDGQGHDLSSSSGFPFTPRSSVHVYMDYSLPRFSFGRLAGRVDWSYRDTIQFLLAKPELNSGRPVRLLNARITLDEIGGPGDTTFRVSAWGRNLTNEAYWTQGVNIYNTLGFNLNTYGEPRLYGVDLEFAF